MYWQDLRQKTIQNINQKLSEKMAEKKSDVLARHMSLSAPNHPDAEPITAGLLNKVF
jgi:hypothetical protein